MPQVLIDILIGAGVTLLAFFLCQRVLPTLTRRTKSDFDDFALQVLADAIIPLGVLIILFLVEDDLGLKGDALTGYDILLRLSGTILIVRMVNKLGARFLKGIARRSNVEDLTQLLHSLMPLLQASIWVIGILILLQSFGVKMGVIWGLLSAGGIGLGLALKEPAQELFAYFMILLDKPFTVGQYIAVGSNPSRLVERIGVRSTHLRSLRGEAVVVNNSALTNATILNFADMEQRRMIYSIGVTYDTTPEQMKEIPSLIESIISGTDHATFNRCHFTEFADSSLNFELVYYIDTRVYTTALNAQQAINLAIMEEFGKRGIEFAFPSQTLYLEGLEGDSLKGTVS
ncbi:MAG: mechanosensitive ion channel protein MscS [Cyanobium sp. NAT70]|nr:mechanosensitive ion channel protein MscS [Cyanobium sp. NAT70]|tara:strand:+ start:4070 stop:5101 length:1032 start_codon:yes stop_codon:yes gene_type:complete